MKWHIFFIALGATVLLKSSDKELPQRPKISRRDSKEVATKITDYIEINSPVLESAIADSLRTNPNYHTLQLEETHGDNELIKEELMKWALEELAEQHSKKKEEHKTEKKKRIFASIVVLLTTMASVITPIITYYYTCEDKCSCG